jgi:hypothetical protein
MRRVWPTPMSSFHRVVESGRDLKRSRLRIDRADARVCKQAAYHPDVIIAGAAVKNPSAPIDAVHQIRSKISAQDFRTKLEV